MEGRSAAQPRRRCLPSTRDRRSPGAAVARNFVRIPKPTTVYVKLNAEGGSEVMRTTKPLRKGDLSAPSTRFALLYHHVDGDQVEEMAAAGEVLAVLHGDAEEEAVGAEEAAAVAVDPAEAAAVDAAEAATVDPAEAAAVDAAEEHP